MVVDYGEFKGNKLIILKRTETDTFPFQFGKGKAKLIVENIKTEDHINKVIDTFNIRDQFENIVESGNQDINFIKKTIIQLIKNNSSVIK